MNKSMSDFSIFNPSNKSKWIQPRAYYMHYYNTFDMAFHSHDRMEIMYVLMGEMQIEYLPEDGEVRKMTILPNNYVFIDAEVPHKISVDGTATRIYNIELAAVKPKANFSISSLANTDGFVKEFIGVKKDVLMNSDDGVFLQNLLLIQRYIGDDINAPGDNYLDFVMSAMILLISKQYCMRRAHKYGTNYINKAISYIYENYNRDVTLPELADHCEISPNYLNTLFSKSLGCTVKNYVNRYRINRAALLLRTSDLAIEEIREQIGYNNKISFHQNFVKFIGMPPRKYRQENRETNMFVIHAEGKSNKYFV